MQKFLRRAEVIKVTGIGRSRLYEMVAEGSFPKPVKISTNLVGWVDTEVAAWQQARIAERDRQAA